MTPVENFKINIGVGYTGFQDTYKNSDYYDRVVYGMTGTMPTKEYNKRYIVVAV